MNLPAVRNTLRQLIAGTANQVSVIDVLDAHERGWLIVCRSGGDKWYAVTEAGRREAERA